jgi:hypothetical protein
MLHLLLLPPREALVLWIGLGRRSYDVPSLGASFLEMYINPRDQWMALVMGVGFHVRGGKNVLSRINIFIKWEKITILLDIIERG